MAGVGRGGAPLPVIWSMTRSRPGTQGRAFAWLVSSILAIATVTCPGGVSARSANTVVASVPTSSVPKATVQTPTVPTSTAGRVRVDGRVILGTGTMSARRLQVFVRTASGGLQLYDPRPGPTLRLGDSVAATGTLAAYRGTPELRVDRVVLIASPTRVVQPLEITALRVPRHVGDLVTLAGRVTSARSDGGDPLLDLVDDRAGGHGPSIALFVDADGSVPVSLSRFTSGDRLRVTGVLARRDSVPGVPAYVLYPRQASDVSIIDVGRGTSVRIAFGGGLLALGAVGGLVLLCLEVRRKTRALAAERARYRMMFDDSPAANFVASTGWTVIGCNQSFATLFGYDDPRHALASWNADVHLGPSRDALRIETLTAGARIGPRATSMRREDGTALHVLATVIAPAHADGEVHGFLIDVTAQQHLENELRHRAFHDPLTGLANRALFDERITQALARTQRAAGPQPVAVLCLDLDDFKGVNDTHGHAAGDEVLRAVARRLLSATRGSDVVARLGGDEFAILLEGAGANDDARIVAERILAAMQSPIVVPTTRHRAGCRAERLTTHLSVGLAVGSLGSTATDLVGRADAALYEAKRAGKNQYAVSALATSVG